MLNKIIKEGKIVPSEQLLYYCNLVTNLRNANFFSTYTIYRRGHILTSQLVYNVM